ncbi:hypothetical protein T439DRAFT_380394 [Meredithblackwellia eburnea MCA 4105]
MEALWASPSLRSPSPPESPRSFSNDDSLELPSMLSPFKFDNKQQQKPWHNKHRDDDDDDDDNEVPETPSKRAEPAPEAVTSTPSWLTDDLEEEWVEQSVETAEGLNDGDEDENGEDDGESSFVERTSPPPSKPRQQQRNPSNSGSSSSGSSGSGGPGSTYASLNKPRVPSSLRYAFTSSTTSTATGEGEDSNSSAGTFVVHDSLSAGRGRGGESQLQQAVRALKGPGAGFGHAADEDEAGEDGMMDLPGKKGKAAAGRVGNLLGLFDPPTPPKVEVTLPPSTVPAPTSATFDFSPPPVPKTSWKSIPHFSPSDSSATPLARNITNRLLADVDIEEDHDETPTKNSILNATAPRPRDRYLRSNALSHSHPRALPQNPSTPARTPRQQSISAANGTPSSALRLFEFQYDTFTRDHLAALVDEIDELGSGDQSRRSTAREGDEVWETAPQSRGRGKSVGIEGEKSIPGREGTEEDEEEEEESLLGSDGRSSKRIRLSPRESAARRRRMAEESGTPGLSSVGRGGSAERRARFLANTRRRSVPRSNPDWASATHPSPIRSPNPDRSLAFAHSLSQSARIESRIRKFDGSASAGAGEVPISTKDRLDEANALLDRIRARTTEKERAKTLLAQSDSSTGETEVAEEPIAPTHSRRPTAISPRKLLRRLSASDEIDNEIKSSIDSSSLTVSTAFGIKEDAPLPHLAAAASASVRSALGQSSKDSPGSTIGLGLVGHRPSPSLDASPSGRRHFARTPVGVSGSRRGHSRTNSAVEAFTLGQSLGRSLLSQKRSAIGEEDEEEEQRGKDEEQTTPLDRTKRTTHSRHQSLTTISPADVEALLANAATPSRMVFDKEQGRWIKAPRGVSSHPSLARINQVEEMDESGSTEDDPFRDFETTKASDLSRVATEAGLSGLGIAQGTPPARPGRAVTAPAVIFSPADANHFSPLPKISPLPRTERPIVILPEEDDSGLATWTQPLPAPATPSDVGAPSRPQPQPEISARPDVGELEEREPTDVFDREESPFDIYKAMHSHDTGGGHEDKRDEEEEEEEPDERGPDRLLPLGIDEPLNLTRSQLSPPSLPPSLNPNLSPPTRTSTLPPSTPQPSTSPSAVRMPRSALKSAVRSKSDPVMSTPAAGSASATSTETRVPRSVSFSDGKLSGKIEGLVIERPREPDFMAVAGLGSRLKFEVSAVGSSEDGVTMGPNAEAGSLEMDDDLDHEEDGTPVIGSPESLRARSMRTDGIERALQELQANGEDAGAPDTSIIISSFESAPPVRPKKSPGASRTFRRTTAMDATFLTECSFSIGRDRLVQYITDVEPFEPDWEGLRSITLAKKGAESLVRMKDFLPNLDEVDLSDNEIAFLTGVPSTLRTLVIPNNRLSSLTSFGHLRNLERIDMSNNQIDSVNQLSCLVHLRELKADNNQIKDLGGLAAIDGLLRLSLKGNLIETLDLGATTWTRLEMLNLSRNNISTVINTERLQSLAMLNLDHNQLSEFEPSSLMPRLRVLRLCSNRLDSLDIGFAPKLRTLFVDATRLGALVGTDRLRKLENLSVRDQNGAGLTLPMEEVRDVKRLYLSGNPLPPSFPSAKFFNLTYLELAMCGLLHLPLDIASLIPNVRVLNLNFNFLDDLKPLTGLARLKQLSVVGARLGKCRPVVEVLGSMGEIESVDFRMNPLTLPFYAPLVLQQGSDLPPHSDYRILHPEDDQESTNTNTDIPRSRQWAAIDQKFRKALPDPFYLRRKTYRTVLMKACESLVELDGLEMGRERKKLLTRA